jgi:hypothetical protein
MAVAARHSTLLPTTNPRGPLLHPHHHLRPASLAVAARSSRGCWRTTNSTLRIARRRSRSAPKVAEEPRRRPLRWPRFLVRCRRQFLRLARREAGEPRRLLARRARPLCRNVRPTVVEVPLRLHPDRAARLLIPRAGPALATQAAAPLHARCPCQDFPARAMFPAMTGAAQLRSERPARAACDPRQFRAHRPEERRCRPAAIPPVPLFFH